MSVRPEDLPAVDVALLGGGGAGLAVLHHVALELLATADRPGSGASRPPLRIAVVDPVDRLATLPADRTWCSWGEPGAWVSRALAPAVHRSWAQVVLVEASGRPRVLDLGALRYRMVRSEDWYALVAAVVGRARERGLLDVVHVAAAGAVDGPARVVVPGGGLDASWVLDSRPAPPARAGASTLLQHFVGERVRAAGPAFDPARAVLMDFSVPQPPVGLAFGYVLPSDERTALVEYTEFSPAVLGEDEYAAALGALRARALGGAAADRADDVVVEHRERGTIPMTDAPFARRTGARTRAIGTAGGAVRPSTGYAFTALQRQARALAVQLVAQRAAGRTPARLHLDPPRPYPRRHAWMDALVLRGLLDGSLDGPAFFTRLFAANPPERVLRFLDGLTGPAAEVALMASAPRSAMLRLAVRDARGRGRRALDGGGPGRAGASGTGPGGAR